MLFFYIKCKEVSYQRELALEDCKDGKQQTVIGVSHCRNFEEIAAYIAKRDKAKIVPYFNDNL